MSQSRSSLKRKDGLMTSPSRILLFTGNGKGKTTAALGMVLRALGHGMRAAVYQFVKDDDTTGELTALGRFEGAHIVQLGLGFVPPKTSPAFRAHKEAACNGLEEAGRAMASGQWDIVVLDEVNIAVSMELVAEGDVVAAVQGASVDTVVVLTGRNAAPGLVDLADTVTEMRIVKHGYAQGREAQKGVEF
jgi:cob(I)alamin adenosyltransferase